MKKKIRYFSCAIVCGILFLNGLPIKVKGLELNDTNVIDLPVDIQFSDPDDHKLVKPGQSGEFEVSFTEVNGIKPSGWIRLTSMCPEYFEIDENNVWIAKKEGVIPIQLEYQYSKETMDEFREMYPGKEFVVTEELQTYMVTVSEVTPVFRLYNPNSGEHLFTDDRGERKGLMKLGWKGEGVGWYQREENATPLRRVYNPNSGDHHYTQDMNEVQNLLSLGWLLDDTALYSEGEQDIPVYRCYNPNSKIGNHHFTTNKAEYDSLVKQGWNPEGIAFYTTSTARITTFDPLSPDNLTEETFESSFE